MAKGGKRPKKPKREPKWKMIERVVAALERTLTPDAKVEHDVDLPDLRLPGKTRQCDVIVRTGTPPRDTLTIVEVQRRGKRVDLNTYGGWLVKREAVGAQHLICVSTKGFPESVILDAQLRGPSVRLVLLRELEQSEWPMAFALGGIDMPMVGTGRFTKIAMHPAGPSEGQQPEGVHGGDQVFEREGYRYSLDEIAKHEAQMSDVARLPAGTHLFRFATDPQRPFRWVFDGGFAVVRFECEVVAQITTEHVPVTVSSYEQVNINGAIAWVMRAEGHVHGGPFEMQITFTPAPDGRLRVGEFTATPRGGDGISVHFGDEARLHLTAYRQDAFVSPPDPETK